MAVGDDFMTVTPSAQVEDEGRNRDHQDNRALGQIRQNAANRPLIGHLVRIPGGAAGVREGG